jgi:hypothetical protein
MFIGHYALGFAFKRLDPRVSLATTFLAAQLADILWPVLVLTGAERVEIAPGNTLVTPLDFASYPWSHSLVTLAVLACLFGTLHYIVRRRVRTAALLVGLVLSHWGLDVISHGPDMPLTPWSTSKLGFGLWNSYAGTIIVEGGLFAIGVALALSASRGRDAIGRWGLVSVVSLLVVIYVSSFLSPPPPSGRVVALVSLSAPLLLLPLIAWIDRHREPRTAHA